MSESKYDATIPGWLNPPDVKEMLGNRHFSTVVMDAWKIYRKKGNDYTRGQGDLDRTDNFKVAAENNGITPFQAWGVYFYKQVAAIWRFLKDGKVESEPIESRIYDVINYSILLMLIVNEQRKLAGMQHQWITDQDETYCKNCHGFVPGHGDMKYRGDKDGHCPGKL